MTGIAGNLPTNNVIPSFENTSPTEGRPTEGNPTTMQETHLDPTEVPGAHLVPARTRSSTPDDPARLGLDLAAETEHDSCNRSGTGDQHFTNPLVNGPPAFTADEFGEQCMHTWP